MNIPVGMVSSAARAAIEAAGGRIETTLKEGVVMAALPGDNAEIVLSNNAGALIQMGDTTLYLKRAWNTENCTLKLQSEL